MSLTPTTLTLTVDPAVYLVPEDYQAGTLAVLVAGVALQPGVDYDAAGDGNRTVTFTVAPSGWVAGTWVDAPGFGTGHYLSSALLQARVGGAVRYLELTDDNRDGTADPEVEEYLLTQVDTIVDSFARRAGYSTPLTGADIESVLPFLVDIGNYKAQTRGSGIASEADLKLYNDAMAMMNQLATGAYELPGYQSVAPIAQFGFDSEQDANGVGSFFNRYTLRGM